MPNKSESKESQDKILLIVLAIISIGLVVAVTLNLINQEEQHIKAVREIDVSQPDGSRISSRELEANRLVEEFVKKNPEAQKALFTHYEMTNKSMSKLANLKKLEILDLSFTRIGDDGLQYLTELPIKQLMLMETKVSDSGLKYIAKIKSIEYLNLASTNVSDKGIEHLRSLPHICDLHLEATSITDNGIADISKNHKRIWKLVLSATNVTDNSLPHLAKLPELMVLLIDRTKVTANGLTALSELPKLKSLSLKGCNISDTDIPKLADSFPHLESLDITSTRVTDRGKKFFQSRLPNCKIVK